MKSNYLAWAFYWVGDIASKSIFHWQPEWVQIGIYRFYSWLMIKSADLQFDDKGPWNDPEIYKD